MRALGYVADRGQIPGTGSTRRDGDLVVEVLPIPCCARRAVAILAKRQPDLDALDGLLAGTAE
jgi:hypothetical protein